MEKVYRVLSRLHGYAGYWSEHAECETKEQAKEEIERMFEEGSKHEYRIETVYVNND